MQVPVLQTALLQKLTASRRKGRLEGPFCLLSRLLAVSFYNNAVYSAYAYIVYAAFNLYLQGLLYTG